MKLNEKQKLTVILLVLGLGFAGLGTLTFFKFSERMELDKEMERLVEQEKAASEKIKRIPQLREERGRLASTIDEYAKILPKETHVEHDAFVDTIDTYRQDTNIVIKRAEYVPAVGKATKHDKKKKSRVQPKKFIRHRYKFELVGTVQDFISFANKIENHTRFLKIDEFNIRPKGAPAQVASFDSMTAARELVNADDKEKEIDLTISTYTYNTREQS